MEQKNIFRIKIGHKEELATQNLINGSSIFGEKIVSKNNVEYMEWNPYKSKLAASIRNGLQIFPIIKKTNIERMNTVLSVSIEIIKRVTILLYPIMPECCEKILSLLNINKNDINISMYESISSEPLIINDPFPIFPRIELND